MGFDIVIRGGRIYDGTGNPWFRADIGISDGKIVRVSRTPLRDADRVIDATGLAVSPGFINLHSHSDVTILYHNNAENCLAMGLVTELTGNCGISVAPVTEKYRDAILREIRSLAFCPIEGIEWTTLGDWMKKVEEKGLGINIAPLIGHGTVRGCVMGKEGEGGERVVPTEEEMEEMKAMVEEAMKEGAFGMSTGLVYAPGRNALTDEIIELCKVVAKYGGVYTSHIRSEGDQLIEAVWEFIEICERAGVRGVISHHKASGRNNFGKVCETLRLVDRARRRGIEIIIDQYPWRIGGVTKSLGGRFKPEVKTRRELVEKLKDPEEWEKLKAAMMKRRERERALYEERRRRLEEKGGWAPRPYAVRAGGVILYSKKHPEFEGKSFQEVADAMGVDDVWEALRALLIEDEGYTVAGNIPYSEEDIVTVMRHPVTTVSTDQYAMDNSKVSQSQLADNLSYPHPRGWGTYPKILGKYVRKEKVLTLEEAIRKMTSLPAQFLGLQDRGLIREGFWADIIVFDPEKVDNRATYGDPCRYPEGIPYVIVNGQLAVDEGEHTGVLAGRVLRNRI